MTAVASRDALARDVWRTLRGAETPPTVVELAAAVGAKQVCSVQRLARKWRDGGFLLVTPGFPMRFSLTDPHPTPPRQRVTGAFDRKPSHRQRLWTAMRVLKRFDVPTLAMAAETNRGTAMAVVNELLRAGYLRSIQRGVPVKGTWSIYLVVRRSGRFAPKVQVSRTDGVLNRTLVDPNDGSRHDISPAAVSVRRPTRPDDGGEG